MDTQIAFGLGMLVVVAVGMLIAIIIGMLKLSHLETELADTQTSITTSLVNIERHLEKVQNELHERIDKESGWIRNDLTHETQTLHRRIDETHSVIDSRFDKFENKISKKQILKD